MFPFVSLLVCQNVIIETDTRNQLRVCWLRHAGANRQRLAGENCELWLRDAGAWEGMEGLRTNLSTIVGGLGACARMLYHRLLMVVCALFVRLRCAGVVW